MPTLKNTMNCFFLKKVNKLKKTSKKGDTKSVDVKHPKTASNLLKPKEYSNKVTQEQEKVEKLNIF